MKNNDKIKIGFDVDSVALNYLDRFEKVFKKFGGTTDVIGKKQFDFFSEVKENEKKALYLTFGYMMNEILELEHEFKYIMKFIIGVNGNVKFITARQEGLSSDAARRSIDIALVNMGFTIAAIKDIVKVTCSGYNEKDMHHRSKVPYILEQGMEYFVEDRRKNVLEIADAGVTVFMPRKSYNEIPDDTKNVIKYNSPIEIINYFK